MGIDEAILIMENERPHCGDKLTFTEEERYEAYTWAIGALKELSSAQSERKKGKWILECDAEGEGDNLYRCPECGCNYSCQEYDIPNFCPNCGSYNGGEQDE